MPAAVVGSTAGIYQQTPVAVALTVSTLTVTGPNGTGWVFDWNEMKQRCQNGIPHPHPLAEQIRVKLAQAGTDMSSAVGAQTAIAGFTLIFGQGGG
jgi:hypothetical protein